MEHCIPEFLEVDGELRQTRNNRGALIHPSEHGICNFWRWFSSSRVLDAETDCPIVAFHGSYRDFHVFDRLTSTQFRSASADNIGLWFSDIPDDDGGAGMYASGEGGALYPVYLNIKRPKHYASFQEFLHAFHAAEGRDPTTQNPIGLGSAEGLHQQLKAEGYDGIVFSKTNHAEVQAKLAELRQRISAAKDKEWSVKKLEREPLTRARVALERAYSRISEESKRANPNCSSEFDKQRVWIAFDPEQVKSAIGNPGTFDPRSPALQDQAILACQDEWGPYRKVLHATDPCGNWKRLQALKNKEWLVLYHATSVEAASGILRHGYAPPAHLWPDSEPGFIYLGGQHGLGTYGAQAAKGSPFALVAVAVRKKDLLPDTGGDWQSHLKRYRDDVIWAHGDNAARAPDGSITYATINQVKARVEDVCILGMFTPEDVFVPASSPVVPAPARRADCFMEP